jgi:signal peptidase I
MLRDVGLAFMGCFLTLVFLLQPYKVEGTSMVPALQDQERILINKWIYGAEEIGRGDIIVFEAPLRPDKFFVKRVIGVPGDTVEVTGSQVLVNGERIAALTGPARAGKARFGPRRIGSDRYFVLGDHRAVSSDSRHWGLVSRSSIAGKVVFRYWPPTSLGPLP